ncbi:hypothetical protein JDV02_000304 [Purpureocillium takamizusanense]|uniref:Uncharacterized protein n=1 Tax=Purpureocillium takamizusanense TaxID=2060973 RepID=A0A9Q8Q6R2_9HYPO|nr:uncharacterized protein JDV02_000304 [Purpureocillium takamizusanense]UNI13574.1 hypothetical protein JDV02_000304 [Purpureocillium takamizusanense]
MPETKKNEVSMGDFDSRKVGESELFSKGFGTCVGVVVTGEPRRGGPTRFLLHLSLGSDWSEARKKWDEFVEAVEASGMRRMRGYLLTIDTTLAKDPDLANDDDLRSVAEGLEIDYRRVKENLQRLVGRDNVVHATHGFGKTTDMKVDENNVVTFNGKRM